MDTELLRVVTHLSTLTLHTDLSEGTIQARVKGVCVRGESTFNFNDGEPHYAVDIILKGSPEGGHLELHGAIGLIRTIVPVAEDYQGHSLTPQVNGCKIYSMLLEVAVPVAIFHNLVSLHTRESFACFSVRVEAPDRQQKGNCPLEPGSRIISVSSHLGCIFNFNHALKKAAPLPASEAHHQLRTLPTKGIKVDDVLWNPCVRKAFKSVTRVSLLAGQWHARAPTYLRIVLEILATLQSSAEFWRVPERQPKMAAEAIQFSRALVAALHGGTDLRDPEAANVEPTLEAVLDKHKAWEHIKLSTIVEHSEDDAFKNTAIGLSTRGLRELVSTYLEAPSIRSTSAECVLLDALVLEECLMTVRWIRRVNNFLPYPIRPDWMDIAFQWFPRITKQKWGGWLSVIWLAFASSVVVAWQCGWRISIAWLLSGFNIESVWFLLVASVLLLDYLGKVAVRRWTFQWEVAPKVSTYKVVYEFLDGHGPASIAGAAVAADVILSSAMMWSTEAVSVARRIAEGRSSVGAPRPRDDHAC